MLGCWKRARCPIFSARAADRVHINTCESGKPQHWQSFLSQPCPPFPGGISSLRPHYRMVIRTQHHSIITWFTENTSWSVRSLASISLLHYCLPLTNTICPPCPTFRCGPDLEHWSWSAFLRRIFHHAFVYLFFNVFISFLAVSRYYLTNSSNVGSAALKFLFIPELQ